MVLKLVVAGLCLIYVVDAISCPGGVKFGPGPKKTCSPPKDPKNKPKSSIESWFTREMFSDLFPRSNQGYGPNACSPYSYEAFVIAARYFPEFGKDKRDLAAFFAHSIQETGDNIESMSDDCYFRGAMFEWFEGGSRNSQYLASKTGQASDGDKCTSAAAGYCSGDAVNKFFYPCSQSKNCYIGRGALQFSYNFNYGMFYSWLYSQGLNIHVRDEPNLIMTSTNPPLAIMASLWFYMTPQPPKPSMHDIVTGKWNPGPINSAQGYKGPAFGPTSLVINNECGGEQASRTVPGESRRIKAFKWFCKYFKVSPGSDKLLTCKNMPQKFSDMKMQLSYAADVNVPAGQPCKCSPAPYQGRFFYFDPTYFKSYTSQNAGTAKRCQAALYQNGGAAAMAVSGAACLKNKPK